MPAKGLSFRQGYLWLMESKKEEISDPSDKELDSVTKQNAHLWGLWVPDESTAWQIPWFQPGEISVTLFLDT